MQRYIQTKRRKTTQDERTLIETRVLVYLEQPMEAAATEQGFTGLYFHQQTQPRFQVQLSVLGKARNTSKLKND